MKIPYHTKRLLLEPQPKCPWANKMVLNPAMIAMPGNPRHLLMLFRATGECPQARISSCPSPYPIFLGFGESLDGGKNWSFDFSRPAMAPRLEYERTSFIRESFRDERMFDYANGCIEDPRLFEFEDQIYLTVACRAFPPGPYWEHDDPVQCMPDWARCDEAFFGKAVTENRTVTMLYRVDPANLAAREYDAAFNMLGPLHNGDISDDRDVVLFPRRLNIDGRSKIVCIHRPKTPWEYEIGRSLSAPSIFMATGDHLEDFHNGKAVHSVFAVPSLPWEANRIGASFAPLEISDGEWLLPYHGKQDDRVGYTQSFMLLRERSSGLPEITARPAERMFFAGEPWELEGDFTIPCLFSCSGIRTLDDKFLIGYGAADQKLGLLVVSWQALLKYLRSNTALDTEL